MAAEERDISEVVLITGGSFRDGEPVGSRWRGYLAERDITLIGGSVDEAPMAYKEIETVVGLQGDLVDLVGRFTPKIVRMDAGGKPRSKKKREKRNLKPKLTFSTRGRSSPRPRRAPSRGCPPRPEPSPPASSPRPPPPDPRRTR